MDWTDASQVMPVVAVTVGLLSYVVTALLRRWWPAFEVTSATQKWLSNILVTFVVAFAAQPGTIRERFIAGLLAVVTAQFAYLQVRNARRAIDG